ncbi:MAG: response regulator [bacterium]
MRSAMANLLIVDDNPHLREGMGSYLRQQGHQPMLASGVVEAVELARVQHPDLILSDLIMDDGTGVLLRQEVRKLGLNPEPYFILVTGHPTTDNAREAKAVGVDLYLTKPFQMPALALAVNNGLNRRVSTGKGDVLASSEAFYHDFFLALNPVLPRLLMLLEGRYGGLGPEQVAAVSSIFEVWRGLVWTMSDFYHRLEDPHSGGLERRRWSGPAALKRVLGRLKPDLDVAQLSVDTSREPRLPLALVHEATAEALIEALVLRLASFSAPGAVLYLSWETTSERLLLNLSSDQIHPDLNAELMRNVALLPPVLPLLEQAGVRIVIVDSLGPWTLSFERPESTAKSVH